MERADIKILLAINRATFPNFYKDLSVEDLNILVNSWYLIFKNQDKNDVERAFMQALRSATYPVTPNDVGSVLRKNERFAIPTNDELFELAEDAGEKIAEIYHEDIGYCDVYHDDGSKEDGKTAVTRIFNELPALLQEKYKRPENVLIWYNRLTDANRGYRQREFNEEIETRISRRYHLKIPLTQTLDTPFLENLILKLKKGDTG